MHRDVNDLYKWFEKKNIKQEMLQKYKQEQDESLLYNYKVFTNDVSN